MIHKNIRVSGRVQGVGYRYSAYQTALLYGIKGFVKNRADGSVYVEAEGEQSAIDLFLAWCHQGPSRAIIDKVEVSDSSMADFSQFTIQ